MTIREAIDQARAYALDVLTLGEPADARRNLKTAALVAFLYGCAVLLAASVALILS